MNEKNISRSYLETLSFSDLVGLADEYGVDVPEDLDRRFLIAELIELAEEENIHAEEMIISAENEENEPVLCGNYNETQVSCVLRNPAWLFVFWNINENDLIAIKDDNGHLKLRICFMASSKDVVPEESFEIQASATNQQQYVLIPSGKYFIKVELIYVTAGAGRVLSYSPVISIPKSSEAVTDLQPGNFAQMTPLLRLSGMETCFTEQYKKHRHSFS